jgi:hypothetical protein
MWGLSNALFKWRIIWSDLNSCARILNRVGLRNCTKCVTSELLPIYKKNLHSFIVFSATYIILLQYTRYFQSQASVVTLQIYFKFKFPLSYVYYSFANTDLTSYKGAWMYYEIHEFFALNIFFVKEPNSNLSVNPSYISLKCPHTTIACIHSLKANVRNQGTL